MYLPTALKTIKLVMLPLLRKTGMQHPNSARKTERLHKRTKEPTYGRNK
jgi:hypothetical protein